MGWETRAGGEFYYRKVRQGRRVRSVYCGAGAVAAYLDWEDRAFREAAKADDREELRALEVEAEERERPIAELSRETDLAIAEFLTIAGFHRHHRGEWRRRRMGDIQAAKDKSAKAPARYKPGDLAALQEKWDRWNLAARAMIKDVRAMCEAEGMAKDMMVELERIRADLAGPSPSALESLAIDRIIATTLDVWREDYRAATMRDADPSPSFATLLIAAKIRDRAHARHLAALRALAQIRRLGRRDPAVLVGVQIQGTATVADGGGAAVKAGATPPSLGCARLGDEPAALLGFGPP
jgi:hypothetical protein